MNNIVHYSNGNYQRNRCLENVHRGQRNHAQFNINNQLKMAEIEAGHMLRDELHNATRGKNDFHISVKSIY
jgi:hypothetical protein